MKRSAKTTVATIYVGTYNKRSRAIVPPGDIEAAVQRWCDEVGACVTITPTRFIYTNGCEDGVAVGLINYPRFPLSRRQLISRAMDLAANLKDAASQWGVSVVGPGRTILLSDSEGAQ